MAEQVGKSALKEEPEETADEQFGVSASNVEDDVQSDSECPDFCEEFLGSLTEEMRGRIVHLIHSILQRKIDVASPLCEAVLKQVEKESGIESFVYGQVLKQIVLALTRASQTEDAVQLIERRLSVMNNEDFSTLMILGIVYDKKGEYKNAMETYTRANDSANQNGNNLQGALSLVKLASSYWNLEQPEQSRQFRERGCRTLEQSNTGNGNSKALSPEVLIWLLDYHKTVAYLLKVSKEFQAGKAQHTMALDIIKKNGCSRVSELKTLSWLSHSYSQLGDALAVTRYNQRALQIVEEILNNSNYISAHASQIIHIMSRIAFACHAIHNLEAALEVRKKSLTISRKFLGDAHPEVARTAADLVLLCHKRSQPRLADEFCKIYETSLEECQYKSDEKKLKLYVREISDALNNFAFSCVLQSNYAQAEESYKESLRINEKVYGDAHPRTSKILRFLGRLYNKWGKHEMAKEKFRACLDIVGRYQPDDLVLLNSIRKELDSCGKRNRSGRGHVYRQ